MNAETIQALEKSIDSFKNTYDGKVSAIARQLEALETAVARSEFRGGGTSAGTGAQAAREHKEQFLAWARKGGNEAALREFEIRAGLSTQSDPDGGYMVFEEMDKNIESLTTDSLAMRRIARIVKTQGEYKRPISKGGAGGGWVTEMETRDETDSPELAMFAPPMAEMYALPECTQKLLDMAEFPVGEWLEEEINITLTEVEGAAFITGDGVGKPHGIIDTSKMVANASWEFGKTGYIAGGHASLLNNVDTLLSLQHSLKPVYRKRGAFLMNDNTFEIVRKFKDGNGNFIWRPGLEEDAPDYLLGKPLYIDDNMPDIGANTYPIAFGDFKRAYTIVDHKSGLRLIRDNVTKKGWVKFFVVKRVAGGISNSQAIKFLKIAVA